uniref:Uncharacterized protein n=1 Tax=Acrobeloides nanus TaxID=290746 RepID=A0A914E2M7_9BILA
MSSQLNWALMAQAISLLSASVLPLLTTIYTKIMKNDAVNSIALAMLIFSWIPWINPLLTICVVGQLVDSDTWLNGQLIDSNSWPIRELVDSDSSRLE